MYNENMNLQFIDWQRQNFAILIFTQTHHTSIHGVAYSQTSTDQILTKFSVMVYLSQRTNMQIKLNQKLLNLINNPTEHNTTLHN